MKKLLIIALIAFSMTAKAQITLEHVYDSASTHNYCLAHTCQLMIINFEVSGERYVKINRCGNLMSIYDMNHSLVKNISLASFPSDASYNAPGDILYLSEHLFNNDSKIEFMYCYNTNGYAITNIYNENEVLLFSDTSAPIIKINFPSQQYPIYNTLYGTKMILSCINGQAKVFSLPGTLTTAIAEANNNLIEQNNISNPYPNPAVNSTQIDYELPKGTNQGEIVFYNLQGKEVKRFKVDNTFNSLLISTSDLAAGTYYYQLQTSGQNSAGKKMVVIK